MKSMWNATSLASVVSALGSAASDADQRLRAAGAGRVSELEIELGLTVTELRERSFGVRVVVPDAFLRATRSVQTDSVRMTVSIVRVVDPNREGTDGDSSKQASQ